mgnify:CR=1 FL=1
MHTHVGARLFITGIPTSGKSYLAKKIAQQVDGVAVLLDDLKKSLAEDPTYKKWTNFYLDLDEGTYLSNTSPEEKWMNLVKQSEGLWPAFLAQIESYRNETKPVIFECVNLLPHLMAPLGFPGVVLVGSTYESVLERNIKDPRWGATPELQELEAKIFFFVERPRYIGEAKKYGYPVFETADEAFEQASKVLKSN